MGPRGPVTLTHKTPHHTRPEPVTDGPSLLTGCLASLALPLAQPGRTHRCLFPRTADTAIHRLSHLGCTPLPPGAEPGRPVWRDWLWPLAKTRPFLPPAGAQHEAAEL